jgi:uncharacterized protein YidB (DUF937 family)
VSLIDSLLGALGNNTAQPGDRPNAANSLMAIVGPLLAQNGGVQGLMDKFSKGGLGDLFASWVGVGQNRPITAAQIQQALGSDQVAGVAAKLGIDPQQALGMLAQFLPVVVDKLTPSGRIGETATNQPDIASVLSDLLQNPGDLIAGEPPRPPVA